MHLFSRKISQEILWMIFLVGIGLVSTTYAAPPAGQSYPYTIAVSSGTCDTRGDIGLSQSNGSWNCFPQGTTAAPTNGGPCGAGYAKAKDPASDRFLCMPTAENVAGGGVSNIECPAGTQKVTNGQGIINCVQPGNESSCTPALRIYDQQNRYVGCNASPTSIITNTPPSGAKITQQLHAYQTTYTLPCQPIAGGQCPSEQTPAGYIARLYQFGLMIVGLFAFGGIVYGALKYILSAGNLADQSDAKDQMTAAVVGLLLLLGSFLILYTINPAITNIQNPNLEVINIKNIISNGEANTTGTPNQIATGGGGGDPLCKLAVNTQINLSTGADFTGIQNSFIGQEANITDTPTFPNGTQSTGYKCINCKNNAHREGDTAGIGGKCVCNLEYTEVNGECALIGGAAQTTCTNKPGYSVVDTPTGPQCLKTEGGTLSNPTGNPAGIPAPKF